MKLDKHSGNMSWKVHEVACSLHEIDFALPWSHLTKEVKYYQVFHLNVLHQSYLMILCMEILDFGRKEKDKNSKTTDDLYSTLLPS